MELKGLMSIPEFDNLEKYVESGIMTEVTEEIVKCADEIQDDSDPVMIRNILLEMNKRTKRLANAGNDERKFKRTAEEILISGERTGCCDSSTLFTALARAKGIPTMQVITFNIEDALKTEGTSRKINSGHFFTACYITENRRSGWKLIDSDRTVTDEKEITWKDLDLNNRLIDGRYYVFAYANDYRDVEVGGTFIDSIDNMGKIQKVAYESCNKNLLKEKGVERE